MIKQVMLPKTIKTHSALRQMINAGVADAAERHNERKSRYANGVLLAEAELDTALNDGFAIVAQYSVDTDLFTAEVFVLHKPD